MMSLKNNSRRRLAALLIIVFLSELAVPTAAFALTSGPSQPEFTSFEPVATTNMVNEFTGDLTYNLPVLNIPGPDGGGYALSLSYHSGTAVEEEASWVGYGWSLNPGAINRNKRGFADDWNGKPVTYYNKTVPNKTVTLGGNVGELEIYSFDLFQIGVNGSLRYNNYKGFGYTIGAGISTTDGVFSLGYHLSDGDGSFSAQVRPGALLNRQQKKAERENEKKALENAKAAAKAAEKEDKMSKTPAAKEKKKEVKYEGLRSGEANSAEKYLNQLGSSGYGMLSTANAPSPSLNTPFNGTSFRLNIGIQVDPIPPEISPFSGSVFGSYSTQKNVEKRTRNAYGYQHSNAAWDDDNSVMDYDVERPSGFNKRDLILPVPYSNPDNYSLTGEGLSGGFRMHHRKIGEFRPERAESVTGFIAAGLDLDIGLAIGVGVDLPSGGRQKVTVGPWDEDADKTFTKPSSTSFYENTFFRFTNDMGGSHGYGDYSSWNQPSKATGGANVSITQPTTLENNYTSRSSFIGANTNRDILRTSDVRLSNPSNTEATGFTDTRVYAYEKREDINVLAERGNTATLDQYGEFSIVNESGSRYTYGLPVYTRNEETVNVEVKSGATFMSKFLAYQSIPGGNEIDLDSFNSVVGSYCPDPSASTYLLSTITTSDYIDRTMDGPTPDDFGGYTKFNYEKNADWYRYRTPYEGLNYSKNSFSDTKDDMAGYSSGEKEIYYLKSVETKSHIAVFYTGCRKDGVEAQERDKAARGIGTEELDNTMKKLEKIVLFKKGEDFNISDNKLGKEIQTTYFQYDYSTQSGLTNGVPALTNFKENTACDQGGETGNGKLTLKKVWSEYDDIFKAVIAPYQFDYEYPHLNGSVDYTGLGEGGSYQDFMSHAAGTSQSQKYSPLISDAWGNYQSDESRHDDYQRWLDQSNDAVPNEDFDPAMWQLKRITLPSGGEIHVQYEQDDYTYVQHETAHMMVSLEPDLNDGEAEGTDRDDYYILNLDDVGLTNASDVNRYADQIRDLYVNTGRKMYFKFLYKLLGYHTPQLEDCRSDFISGYMTIRNVEVYAGTSIKIFPDNDAKLPRQLCRDFVRTQKAGNLTSGSCDPTETNNVFAQDDPTTVVNNLKNFVVSFNPLNKCQRRNQNFSYLRVPLYRGVRTVGTEEKVVGKRGGGLRVKRLMMYDNGLATGERSLYGSEYHYITKDFEGNYISSGVATNEPAIIRNENPMVTFMKRLEQGIGNRLIAGRDKKQMEGPLGENILPGASVGYSKVITTNIHTGTEFSGKTHTGYTAMEFYTAYDCPFYYSENLDDPIDPQWAINRGSHVATDIDKSGSTPPVTIPAGVVNFSDFRVRARQGFNFAVNNMHGQVKSSRTFSNRYYLDSQELQSSLMTIEDQDVMVAAEVHDYCKPGEKLKTINSPFGADIEVPLGVEQEITFESKRIKDLTTSLTVELDGGASLFGFIPLPFGSVAPTFTSVNNQVYTHVTTKITNFPAIEKSMSRYLDGIWHTTVNEKFDYYTGRPAVVKTYDDFNLANGSLTLQDVELKPTLTNHDFSAPMVYDNMGQKSEHEGKYVSADHNGFNMSKAEGNQIIFGTNDPSILCEAAGTFPPGSLIQLGSGMNVGGYELDLYHVDKFENGMLTLLPVSYSEYTDVLGDIDVKIIRSGKTNQLVTSVGNVSIYGEGGTITEQPSAVELSQMSALVDELNGLLDVGGGVLTANELSSLIPDLNVFINDSCQLMPNDHSLSIINNHLNVNYTAYLPGQYNKPCEEISPSITSLLNQYWDGFLMNINVKTPVDSECSDKKFDLAGEPWIHDFSQTTPVDIMKLADDIFSQDVFPELDEAECTVKLSDYYEPIFRDLVSIPGQPVTNGGDDRPEIKYRNGEIIIHDILQDVYYVAIVECSSGKKGGMSIYYGVTDANGIGVDPKFTDYDQLLKVPFYPEMDPGEFIPNSGEQCMVFRYLNNMLGVLYFQHELTEVSTMDLDCGDQAPQNIISCSQGLPMMDMGSFGIDVTSGEYSLVYYPYGEACGSTSMDITCLSFCDFSRSFKKDVIASSFTTFDDNWDFDHDLYTLNFNEGENFGLTNKYETGERGKWRAKSSYVYSEDRGLISDFESTELKNYNSGVYDMVMFDWNYPDDSDRFKKINTVTQYSPNGNPIEEKNIIDVYSAAKFGYNHIVPYIVAQNSDYSSIFFESFENKYMNNFLEDGVQLTSGTGELYFDDAHSGSKSLRLLPSQNGLNIGEIIEGNDIQEHGALVKTWVKSDRFDIENIGSELHIVVKDSLGNNPIPYGFIQTARSGDWALFEAELPEDIATGSSLCLLYDFSYSNEILLIDDLRFQPKNSQVNTYVYDVNTLRLLASFDDQNFGLYYQYNAEGQLVRTLKETIRGMKTIQETQYNFPELSNYPW